MPPKILLVDDEDNLLELLSHMLSRQGYEIISAYNGEMALKLAREEMPDLIMMDLYMPGMDGFEVANEIQQDELIRRIPIIFLSVDGEKEIQQKSFEVGAVDFITKPFDWQELLTRVASRLKHKQSEDADREQLKVETLSQLMVTLAHHINNVLGRMLIQLEITPEDNPQKVGELKEDMERGIAKIKMVVASLEEMARQGEVASEEYVGMKDAMLNIHEKLERKLKELEKRRDVNLDDD